MKTIDRFELLEKLGSGGMGAVYKARDTLLDRIVALKILDENRITGSSSRARFEREGVIISNLKHEHIVLFFTFGISEDEIPFIAMEYLEGESLRTRLERESTLEWERALKIGIQICEALAYAHEHKVIHRDLKPENIMLTGAEHDKVKVLDFGLATMLPDSAAELQKLTTTGRMLGTAKYMSPEQCSGKKPDQRSDIYALACLLFESILGEAPFQADTDLALMAQHTNAKPRTFSSFKKGKDLPEALERVIAKALLKEPAQRYQSMAEFSADLQNVLLGETGNISVPKTKIRTSKEPVMVTVFLVTAVLVTMVLLVQNECLDIGKKKIPEMKTAREVRRTIRKQLALNTNDLPKQAIDAGLALPGLDAVDHAELLYLRARQSGSPHYYCLALNILSKHDPNSYPSIVLLECLYNAARFSFDTSLFNQSHRFSEECCKQFQTASLKSQDEHMASYYYGQAKVIIANVLLLKGSLKFALQGMDAMAKEGAENVELFNTYIQLGRPKPAIAAATTHPSQYTFSFGLAAFCRTLGLINEELLFMNLVKDAGLNGSIAAKQMALVSEVLFWIEKEKEETASNLLEKFIEEEKKSEAISKDIEFKGLKPFIITIMSLCGNLEPAASYLHKSCSNRKGLSDNDFNTISLMERSLVRAPISPPERLKYFVLLARDNPAAHPRLFFIANINRAMMENTSLSEALKCESIELKRRGLVDLGLPNTEVSTCEQLMKQDGSAKIVINNGSDESGLTYFQWAQLRRIELLVTQRYTASARTELDLLRKSKLHAKQYAKIFELILLFRRDKLPEVDFDLCNDADSLRLMATASRRSLFLNFARKCISRAASLPTDEITRLSINTEHALIELEDGKPKAAREILLQTKFRLFKTQPSEFDDKRLDKLALAMALAQMEKETIEVLDYKDSLHPTRAINSKL